MIGAVVLVEATTGRLSAAHVVSEQTRACWDEAEKWLTEDGTDGRLVMRLVSPNPDASFCLNDSFADLMAWGWTVKRDEIVHQGVLL